MKLKITDEKLDDSRFWSKVDVKAKSSCWNWRGNLNKAGYGRHSIGAKNIMAHIFSYVYFYGKYEKGLLIDHICMNKKCVSPSHLRAVTPKVSCTENTNGVGHRNKIKTHCIRGHEFSGENLIIKQLKNGFGRTCKKCVVYHRENFNKRRKALAATDKMMKELNQTGDK